MDNLSILPNDNIIAGDPPAPPAPPIKWLPPPPTYQSVKVVDIEMNFGSMIVFMIKWAIAAIPAFIILMGISMMIGVLGFMGLAAVGIGLGSLTGSPAPSPTPVVRSH